MSGRISALRFAWPALTALSYSRTGMAWPPALPSRVARCRPLPRHRQQQLGGAISGFNRSRAARCRPLKAPLKAWSFADRRYAAPRVGRGFVNAVAHERSRRSISRSGDVEYDTTDTVVGVGMFVLWHVCSSCSWLTGLPTVGPRTPAIGAWSRQRVWSFSSMGIRLLALLRSSCGRSPMA